MIFNLIYFCSINIEYFIQKGCDDGQKCVPYYLCKDDGTINRDGSFIIDERNDDQTIPMKTDKCPSMYTCCKKVRCPVTEPTSSTFTVSEDCKGTVDECGYGNPQDKCKPQPTSSFDCSMHPKEKDCKILCTVEFMKRSIFESGVSNPRGLYGEAKSYQNSTLYAQYAEVRI